MTTGVEPEAGDELPDDELPLPEGEPVTTLLPEDPPGEVIPEEPLGEEVPEELPPGVFPPPV